MTILKHELKQNFNALLIWALSVGIMNFVFMMIYPSMKSQLASMSDVYSNMGNFSAAFGMDKISITTALGFYGIEAGAMISLGGAMFGALIGIAMLAKEEGTHTAEFLFSIQVTRKAVILWKALATVILVVCFDLIVFAFGYGSFVAMQEHPDMKLLLLYHLAQMCMHIQIALMCFGISAFIRKSNVGLGLGLAILMYFLQMFVNISDKAKFLKYITPYSYSDAAKIFPTGSIDGVLLGIGLAIAAIFLGVGFLKYKKKDLLA